MWFCYLLYVTYIEGIPVKKNTLKKLIYVDLHFIQT